jgi:hypothetical protein
MGERDRDTYSSDGGAMSSKSLGSRAGDPNLP